MSKNTLRKNVKKTLGKTYYLILFYLISLHESLNNVNEYVNRGAKPEPELYSLPTSSLLSAPTRRAWFILILTIPLYLFVYCMNFNEFFI